jgi:DNA-binding MarR family transcriptional regulator
MQERQLIEDRKKNKKLKINYIVRLLNSFDVLNRYLEIEMAKADTSPIRFAVMNALATRGGNMIPKDISKLIYRTPRTITSMLDTLEREGMIRREPNALDRRSIVINVTEKGWKRVAKIIPSVDDISEKALDVLSEEEMDSLYNVLTKLRKYLMEEISKGNSAKKSKKVK